MIIYYVTLMYTSFKRAHTYYFDTELTNDNVELT